MSFIRHNWWYPTSWGLCGVAGAAFVAFGVPTAVAIIGFGKGGIVAGSIAASLHSLAVKLGVGMKLISICQSIGAVGGVGKFAVITGWIATSGTAAIASQGKEEKENKPKV